MALKISLPVICLLSALAVAALAFAAPSLAQDKGGKGPQKPQIATIVVSPAAMMPVPRRIRAVGTAIPNQTVAVTSRVESQIMEVKFSAGDNVKAGQVLFLLDDRTLKAALAQAQATLKGDQAQIASLQAQYDRMRQGVQKGFFSVAERDNAKALLYARKAAVMADQAAGDSLQVQLGYTIITAPIAGRTGTINITAGNVVTANGATPLVTINQIEPIAAQMALPQDSFDAVRKASARDGGANVSATRAGVKGAAQGKLAYIDNTISTETGTFAARALFPNTDQMIWPGMLVNVTIDLDDGAPVLAVPSVAVQHDGQGDYVFTAESGKARRKPVKVERIQEDIAVIASGIVQGEHVITDGMMSLKEGMAVKETAAKSAVQP